MTRVNVPEQINLELRRNAHRQKKLVILRFPEEALNTKDTARQRRDQKRVPLFHLPRRGGEKREGPLRLAQSW